MTEKKGYPRGRVNHTGRNKGKVEPYVRLPHWMLKSPAWKGLNGNAIKILLHLWGRHNGANNGEIAYSVRDGEEIGLSKSNTQRALDELVAGGFLLVVTASAFTVKNRRARTWALTAEPIGNERPTKDFMRRGDATEIKTQSHGRDTQSHGRDTQSGKAIKLPLMVPPAGLSTHQTPPSQSHRRDTYIYTMGVVADGERQASDDQSQSIEQPDQPGSATAPGRASVIVRFPTLTQEGQPIDPASKNRARRKSRVRADGGVEGQMDIENYLPAIDRPVSPLMTTEAIKTKIAAEGLTVGKVAARLGISRPQLSNAIHGTYQLNSGAKAVLKAWVMEGQQLPQLRAVQ